MLYKINNKELVIRTKLEDNYDTNEHYRVSYLLALVDFTYLNKNYCEPVFITDIVKTTLINRIPNKVTETDLSSINEEFIDNKIKTSLENRIKIIDLENQENSAILSAKVLFDIR